jgi:hypothetical protein
MLLKELVAVVQRPLKERYEESADFDADMDRIEKCLKDALGIARSANFTKHMKDTDTNFDTSSKIYAQELVKAINEAIGAAKELYEEMEKAA